MELDHVIRFTFEIGYNSFEFLDVVTIYIEAFQTSVHIKPTNWWNLLNNLNESPDK